MIDTLPDFLQANLKELEGCWVSLKVEELALYQQFCFLSFTTIEYHEWPIPTMNDQYAMYKNDTEGVTECFYEY